jgi:DNA polymerase-4
MESKLYPLPVRDLFMVGESTERKLKKLGVETIGDLAGLPFELLLLYFEPYRGKMLYNYSHGIVDPPIPLLYTHQEEARKSISHTKTLDKDRR